MTHEAHIRQASILVVAMALVGLLLLEFETWVVLTLAGAAMAMLVFTMASGLTLVFGLMDVLNFGHGAFIAVGAYLAAVVVSMTGGFASGMGFAVLGILGCALAAALGGGIGGAIFEKFLVRPAKGNHMRQILITMGGLIIIEQLLIVVFSPEEVALLKPDSLQGSVELGPVVLERFRILVVIVGLLLFAGLGLLFNRTKLGLLIRAAVENSAMVEALGYPVKYLFVGVFIIGSALAGVGGALWAMQLEIFTATIGTEAMLLVFIVVVTGGLGSISGCFFSALLVGLFMNYVTYLLPPASAFSLIGLMAAILMWRPQGLIPVADR